MSLASEAEAEHQELLKDRARFEFIHNLYDGYDILVAFLEKWEIEDDKDLNEGWYCWKIDNTPYNCGYTFWKSGPCKTYREAIDKGMKK